MLFSQKIKQHPTHSGFTLLEVLVALFIVSMTLSSIMSISAGSKKLAFKAEQKIDRIVFLRASLNNAQLHKSNKYPKYPRKHADSLRLITQKPLKKLKRQTRPLQYQLEPYQVVERNGNSAVLTSLRWRRLKTAK